MTIAVTSTPAFRQMIREGRQALGLTREQIAFGLGLAPTTVMHREFGSATPSDRYVAELAAALDLDPIDLFFSLGRVVPPLRGNPAVLAAIKGAHAPTAPDDS